MNKNNITPHKQLVSISDRTKIKKNKPIVLWFTGLSSSGKSTIANALEYQLVHVYQAHTYLLDGDTIRTGLNSDLGFSAADRQENIRRIGEVTKLMFDAGLIVIASFISPYARDRQNVREKFQAGEFWEIFVSCPLEVCMERDQKGLYKKAQTGEISSFTGISAPYEAPDFPELTLDSHKNTIDQCVEILISRLNEHKVLSIPGKQMA